MKKQKKYTEPRYVPSGDMEKDPPEGRLFALLIFIGIVGAVLGLMYIVGQFFYPPTP
jgi:hypothetical protein